MFAAVDVGGTQLRLGISSGGRRFDTIVKYKTPNSAKEGIQTIVTTIVKLKGERKLHGVALAVPTPVSQREAVRLNFPNLPGWRNIPIAPLLATKLNTKIRMLNDAAAAGLGEAAQGAGRGYDIVAYLTLSTGIGGARIHQGIVDGAAQGFEPGQQILIPNGKRCGCGQRGCFEAYASGTAFYKTYGIRPEDCRDKKIWARHAQIVGWGLINTIVHWSPDVVVIGGGLAQAGNLLFAPLRTFIRTHLKILKPPPIKPAKLGDDAGLYGCLELLR